MAARGIAEIRLAWRAGRGDAAQPRRRAAPTRSTSRPKARSVSRRAPTACAAGCRSRPRSIRASRSSCTPRGGCRRAGATRRCVASMRLGGRAGALGRDRGDPAAAPLREPPALVARHRPRAVPPRCGRRARLAATDLPVRRSHLGREERRGVPSPRPAGLEGRLRRWPAARAPAPRLSGVHWMGPVPRHRLVGSTLAPTRSSIRAAPTPSASSCSKRWRAARRSPLFRSPGRSTSSATPTAASRRRLASGGVARAGRAARAGAGARAGVRLRPRAREFVAHLAPIAAPQGDVGAGAAAARGLIAHFARAPDRRPRSRWWRTRTTRRRARPADRDRRHRSRR